MGRVGKQVVLIFVGLLLLLVLCVVALLMGKYTITLNDVVGLLGGKEGLEVVKSVVVYQRIPRTIMAVLVGASLAVSGFIYQEIFQNKLVSPDILGVSNGAGLGACIAIVLGLASGLIITFSFVLGIVSMLLTFFLSKIFNNRSTTTLVLAGIVISGFMGAGISFVKFMAGSDAKLGEITFWLLGSFSGAVYEDILIFAPIFILCVATLFLLRWRINIVALGKYEAQTKGLNYNAYMAVLIVFVTILTSLTVAYCGVIGWCGLIIPHIVRLIASSDLRKSLSLTVILGAIFMVVCDIISRSFTF